MQIEDHSAEVDTDQDDMIAEASAPGPADALKMAELLDAVGAKSSLKRSDIREAAGLILTEINTALANNREVNLPELGKIKPKDSEEKPGGTMLRARIKLAAAKPDTSPEDTENS